MPKLNVSLTKRPIRWREGRKEPHETTTYGGISTFGGGVGDYVEVDISNTLTKKKKGLRDQLRVLVDENDNIIEMI